MLRSKFANHFRLVVFGILDDHNAHKEHNPEGNIKPFADVFTPRKAVPTLEEAMRADAPIATAPSAAAPAPAIATTPSAAAPAPAATSVAVSHGESDTEKDEDMQ